MHRGTLAVLLVSQGQTPRLSTTGRGKLIYLELSLQILVDRQMPQSMGWVCQ